MNCMNNIYKTFTICAVILLLTSCDDWFDVRPKSQVKEDDLFQTEAGFRDATLGIYTLMGNSDVYGGNMTMGFLDVLAQQYTDANAPYNTAASYSYMDVYCRNMIDAMWKKSYEIIANCNRIIKNVEGSNGTILNDKIRRVVKAEALAVRAYLHFDMLRIFAPSYITGRDKKAIPYVAITTVNPQPVISVAEMCDILLNDLSEARQLLKDVDPICQANYNEQLNYSDDAFLADDGFFLYRTSRLNYYGVTALMARICLYKQDMANALSYSTEVINSGKFQLINDDLIASDAVENQGTTKNYTFMMSVAKHEYISSVYVYKLKEDCNDLYFRDSGSASLRITPVRKTQIFGAEGLDFDVRSKRMFSIPNGSNNEYTCKYFTGTQIPLLKIGEMYLIAAEASGNSDYLKSLRIQRGYHNVVIDDSMLIQEIQQEYQREFFAEGQLFFYYKRMNLPRIPYTNVDATEDVYVLPLPDDELEFGYNIN